MTGRQTYVKAMVDVQKGGKMARRTEDQIRAYVDGYNACFHQFCECLKDRKSVMGAVKKMNLYKDAVNNVVEKGGKNE